MTQENPAQENSERRAGDEETPEALEQPGSPDTSEANKRGIGWREMLRQAFDKARQAQQPTSTRRDLSKDKSKSLLVLVGAAALMLLIFLGIFSAPQKAKKIDAGKRPGTPDLGRRLTPGQDNTQAGSVTPMLNADVSGGQLQNSGGVTPEDVERTARLGLVPGRASVGGTQHLASKETATQYALGRVDFADPALAREPGYGVGPAYHHPPAPPAESTESEELRKPSLVFVRSPENSLAGASVAHPAVLDPNQFLSGLPPGTRLVARLESAVSTAVKEPVVAVIEYNYERNGEIVAPAGAKAIGQLRQADRSGYVDIRFGTLEMPDGSSEKIDGVAMDLRFEPLKGSVSGKKTGTKFLVRAFTGLGTVAAYLVGNGGSSGFYGPVSESALLRERVANNVGIAGDQELNELAFNQNVVVTVPGNTRFYIVLESGAPRGGRVETSPTTLASAGSRSSMVPSLDELRQLLQLKQELSAMYQQGSTASPATQAPHQ